MEHSKAVMPAHEIQPPQPSWSEQSTPTPLLRDERFDEEPDEDLWTYDEDEDEDDWDDAYGELSPVDQSCTIHPDRFAPLYCDVCGCAMCETCSEMTLAGMHCVACVERTPAPAQASQTSSVERQRRQALRQEVSASLEREQDAWHRVHSGVRLSNSCDTLRLILQWGAPAFAILAPVWVILFFGERVARLVAAARLRSVPMDAFRASTRMMFWLLAVDTFAPMIGVAGISLVLFGALEPSIFIFALCLGLMALGLLAPLSRWAYTRFVDTLASGLGATTVIYPLGMARQMRGLSLGIIVVLVLGAGGVALMTATQGFEQLLSHAPVILLIGGLGFMGVAISDLVGQHQMRTACRNLEIELNGALSMERP